MTTTRLLQQDNRALSSVTLFNSTKRKPDEIDYLMARYLEELRDRLPANLSASEKRQLMRDFNHSLKMNRSFIKELITDESFMQTLGEQKQQLLTLQAVTTPEELPPILTRLTNTLPRFDSPSSFTMAALALMMIPAIAAQAIYQAQNGSPPGGVDMCAGQNAPFVSCMQGFVTRANSNTSIMQFSQIVQQAGGGSSNSGTIQAFNILVGCLGWDKLANETITAMSSALQNVSQGSCFAQSTVWNSMQATASLLGPMAQDACLNFQSNFGQTAQRCMSNNAFFVNGWIIAGFVVAGIVGVALLVACVAGTVYLGAKVCDKMPCCP